MDQKTILEFIQSRADRPMKVKELAKALFIEDHDYSQFRRTIKRLIDSGDLVRLKRGRVGVSTKLGVLVGILAVTRTGTGFLLQEGDEEDILISPHDLKTALDGDKVMVRLKGNRLGRPAGQVIRIVERAARRIVGTFRRERHFLIVQPDNPRIHRDFYIPSDLSLQAKDGERVVVELSSWEDANRNPEGKVVERLGFPTDPGVDMLTVMRAYSLPDEFPPTVLEAAERAAATGTDEEQKQRLDLTRECIYTIDPADAKDHDDAVNVERTAKGYRLGVHIADVSFFVKEGSALDIEALERGNSVYLPGMVIPMLPEVLSNDMCSLKPNRRRLAHSVFMEFDQQGKMLKWKIEDTVIKSNARLSYEEVQDYFDGKDGGARIERVAENLTVARELARLLTRQRATDGSLDFDLPEAKIILNDRGEVLELGHRVRLESHRLVEEFMLAANKAVALEVFRRGQSFIYRVHAKPDMEKLEAFSTMMDRLGHRFPASKTIKPIQFSRFLERIKDTPEADFINELMLRSMQKAVYQRENIGHFGLAFTHYTHFTSPIRRYPDLLLHRLLRKLKGGKYPVAYARKVNTTIDFASKHCSETERHAEQAERDAVKSKQVAFMAKHLGDEYDGVISGVAPYGFFVRLGSTGAEGMVRVSTIDDDYYRYDEESYRLIGRRTKHTYRMGDAVRVGIMKVDIGRREIDLFVTGKKAKLPKPAPAGMREFGRDLNKKKKKRKR
ncbi:MAG: ribonuclease R [candidate division Zixibacteria bacterium]|nr:ribonuclease R [candidate division Zixibacteria bacterium]